MIQPNCYGNCIFHGMDEDGVHEWCNNPESPYNSEEDRMGRECNCFLTMEEVNKMIRRRNEHRSD